jgi:hypothetical protein
VSIRFKEWLGRLAEIAANFVLPGLGGLIFDRGNRKNALWQMVLSMAGMVLAGSGAATFLAVFVDSSGLHLEEDYVTGVLQNPEELYKILMGLAGVILGGILVLGGFLWSLENAMKRWRSPKPEPQDLPELSRER